MIFKLGSSLGQLKLSEKHKYQTCVIEAHALIDMSYDVIKNPHGCCKNVLKCKIIPTEREKDWEMSSKDSILPNVTFHEQQECGYGFPSLPLATSAS